MKIFWKKRSHFLAIELSELEVSSMESLLVVSEKENCKHVYNTHVGPTSFVLIKNLYIVQSTFVLILIRVSLLFVIRANFSVNGMRCDVIYKHKQTCEKLKISIVKRKAAQFLNFLFISNLYLNSNLIFMTVWYLKYHILRFTIFSGLKVIFENVKSFTKKLKYLVLTFVKKLSSLVQCEEVSLKK